MSTIAALEALPDDGLTVAALRTLDSVVPGEWTNVIRFDDFIAELAETQNPGVIAAIRQRALGLEGKPKYAQALQVFTMVDTVDQVAAGAAVANKLGGLLGSLTGMNLIEQFTPKPETTQCLDAGVKLIAELIGFGLLNGVPTTKKGSLTRFAGALEDYGRYDLMRIAAWVVFDGLIPLGPAFLSRILSVYRDAASSKMLTNNPVFESLGQKLPGDSVDDKRSFIIETLDSTGDWIGRFVAEKGLTQEAALGKLDGLLKVGGSGADYIAAAVDASTAYYAHTGTQTVARTLARHAVEAQRSSVWRQWVDAQ